MNLLRDAPTWALLLLAGLLVAAAVQDVARRKISNFLCLGVMVTAVVAAIAVGPTIALWQNAMMFALLLVLGLPLFAAGWLGGGDVKLFAALGLWSNLAVALPLISCILIAGGVLALASIAARGPKNVRRSKGVPYGVAIAVGTSVLLLQPILFPPPAANPLDLKTAQAQFQR